MKAFIYALKWPNGANYFYVGSTKDIEKRMENHRMEISDPRYSGNAKTQVIESILNNGYELTADIIDEIDTPHTILVRWLEQYWIEKFGQEYRLANSKRVINQLAGCDEDDREFIFSVRNCDEARLVHLISDRIELRARKALEVLWFPY